MVIYTAKVRWKDYSALLLLIFAFTLCLIGGQQPAVSASIPMETTEQLSSYLESLGWQVAADATRDQILLPEEFTSEYDSYLEIQASGGFDLLPYQGCTVTRYSYPLANYPDQRETVYIDLLVYQGKLIGGDIRSARLDGFMLPLQKAEQAALF